MTSPVESKKTLNYRLNIDTLSAQEALKETLSLLVAVESKLNSIFRRIESAIARLDMESASPLDLSTVSGQTGVEGDGVDFEEPADKGSTDLLDFILSSKDVGTDCGDDEDGVGDDTSGPESGQSDRGGQEATPSFPGDGDPFYNPPETVGGLTRIERWTAYQSDAELIALRSLDVPSTLRSLYLQWQVRFNKIVPDEAVIPLGSLVHPDMATYASFEIVNGRLRIATNEESKYLLTKVDWSKPLSLSIDVRPGRVEFMATEILSPSKVGNQHAFTLRFMNKLTRMDSFSWRGPLFDGTDGYLWNSSVLGLQAVA